MELAIELGRQRFQPCDLGIPLLPSLLHTPLALGELHHPRPKVIQLGSMELQLRLETRAILEDRDNTTCLDPIGVVGERRF